MPAAALPPSPRDIVVDQVFAHPPRALWTVLTRGDLIGRWMSPPSGFEPVIGHRFGFVAAPAGAWPAAIECEVLDVAAPECLLYSWRDAGGLDTTVAWRLVAVEGGVRLRVIHSGFAAPRDDAARAAMSDYWTRVVPAIGPVLDPSH